MVGVHATSTDIALSVHPADWAPDFTFAQTNTRMGTVALDPLVESLSAGKPRHTVGESPSQLVQRAGAGAAGQHNSCGPSTR